MGLSNSGSRTGNDGLVLRAINSTTCLLTKVEDLQNSGKVRVPVNASPVEHSPAILSHVEEFLSNLLSFVYFEESSDEGGILVAHGSFPGDKAAGE